MPHSSMPFGEDIREDDFAPQKEKGRRQSLYDPKYARMAEVHCQLGATTAELANLFNVSLGTIDKWARTHPEFGKSMQKGKAAWDDRVERSLAERAMGYEVDVEEVKISNGEIVRYKVRKKYPPDTTACIFWLKNRRREQWRDVQDHNHEGKVALENLTAEQLLEQIKAEAEELGLVAPQLPGRRNTTNKVQH